MREAVQLLLDDQLVAFPTETVYGLGGHGLHDKALTSIFAAKGRPTSHPLIAHVADAEGARQLTTSWPAVADRLAAAFWPGPLTLVLERAAHVPSAISGGKHTVAVRVPASLVARALAEALGAPIAAPSANCYQALSPTSAEHVVRGLGDKVPLILDGGPCQLGLESTVVDLSGEQPKVLRPGGLPLAALRSVVPGLVLASLEATSVEADRHSPGQDAVHYSPRARLQLLPREVAIELALNTPTAGLVLRGVPPEQTRVQRCFVLSNDPVAFGRDLFSTLHALDHLGVADIYVEAPPEDEAWLAVADRLRRGAAPKTK